MTQLNLAFNVLEKITSPSKKTLTTQREASVEVSRACWNAYMKSFSGAEGWTENTANTDTEMASLYIPEFAPMTSRQHNQ